MKLIKQFTALAVYSLLFASCVLVRGNEIEVKDQEGIPYRALCKSCKKKQAKFISKGVQNCKKIKLVRDVLNKKKQANLTPDEIIKKLKNGNTRFMSNDLTPRDYPSQVYRTTNGQFPKAIVLSCVDSRVPVETIFDLGIGDIFVTRVAGNISNEDILGSMEYACKVAGSKVVLVLGHEHCGAVKSAVKDVKLGNITPLLSKIKPAINKSANYKGKKSYKNKLYMHEVCQNNVKNTIAEIRRDSPLLRKMEENKEIKILGAIYDLDDGKVEFLQKP